MENKSQFIPQTRYAPIDMAYYQQRAKQLKLQNQALKQQTARSPYIYKTVNQSQYVPRILSPPSRNVQYRPIQSNMPIGYYTDNSYDYSGVQNSIIGNFQSNKELQSRNQRLERQAHHLQKSIKTDLMYFVRDSNVHRQCSYKQKYMKALNYRPQYFRINFK